MVSIGKTVSVVIGIVFVLTVLPLAIDEVAAFAVAYPAYATVIGLVSLALVFGLVFTALKASGIKMG